jgi:long-chain acyl-CoA synthetase
MFLDRVAKTPDREAFQYPTASGWGRYTWREVGTRVKAIAGGLRSLGLQNEQRGGILSGTRVEWIIVDIGIMSAGGATTTIYPSSLAEDCAYILKDSGTRYLFVENEEQAAKIASVRGELPDLQKLIVIEGKGGHDGWAITLDELMKAGDAWNAANPNKYEENAQSLRGDSLATLIYTSGTTGKPKGVELTHDCWVFEGEAVEALPFLPTDKQFLWLPMSHSFGKVLEVAILAVGIPTAIDGRIPKIVENLAIVKPTFMAAAPRIFEKVYNKVVTGAQSAGGARWKIFQWSVAVGKEVSKLRQEGKEPSGLLAIKNMIADKLVFSKLRDRFGGRIRFFISGSAPLSRDMAEFFHACNILILEGYGLTESSAASVVNVPDKFRFGTVGNPLPGVTVKIAPEDGEILLGGRGIMRGYHNKPEASAEALKGGWLCTGDIGELDEMGRVRITDRKKDLIKTSGGKYVAPQMLESRLKALCPYLGQVLVHGNARNFCTALVTLDPESAPKWAEEHGIVGKSYADLGKEKAFIDLVQAAVTELNKGVGSWESVKRFAILPADFTVETGELTPSLKVKRKVVETKYKDVLDGFYSGSMAEV